MPAQATTRVDTASASSANYDENPRTYHSFTAVVEIDGANFINDPVFEAAPRVYDVPHLVGMRPSQMVMSASEGPRISIRHHAVVASPHQPGVSNGAGC
ncbi:hypothetical protein F4802DRAFT_601839 [Xylaria palmicola]|nr:hypothetical protein F4802DRAFT_601839 [Xylaria palmicola]